MCAIKLNAKKRRKTNEAFLAELTERNLFVEPLEEYRGTNTKIAFKCKECGYVWPSKPGHILEGHGCPICGGSKKKEDEEFRQELKKINPYVEVLDNYINARTKIRCRCMICTHVWSITPDKLLQGGGCNHCDKRRKTSFPEQAIFFYLRKIYPDVISRYTEIREASELDIFLPSIRVAIEYDGVYWHKQKENAEKRKYDACQSHQIKLYRVKEEGANLSSHADVIIIRKRPFKFESLDECISELFSDMNISLDVDTQRDAMEIRELFYSNIGCNSLEYIHPEIADEWFQEENVNILPSMVSCGSNQKFWWKCHVCRYEWHTSVAERVRGRGCPACANKRTSLKLRKSNEVFLQQLEETNPNLRPIEEYKTAHYKILIHCLVCGNEWSASPANLLSGKGCPKCSRKRAAKKPYS